MQHRDQEHQRREALLQIPVSPCPTPGHEAVSPLVSFRTPLTLSFLPYEIQTKVFAP